MHAASWTPGRARGLRIALLAVLSILVAPGQLCRADPAPGGTPPDRIRADRQRDDYRAALHAVYTEIVAERPGELPEDVRHRLQRAAKVLRTRAEESRSAELARRTAIARLALEDLAIERGDTAPRPVLKYEADFLEPVGAPVAAIEQHIVDQIRKIEAQPQPPVTPSTLLAMLKAALRNSLFVLLEDEFQSNACGFPWKDLDTQTHADPGAAPDGCNQPNESWKDGLVWVEARVKIQRPLADLAKLFDPQSWDEVGLCSPWFERACVMNPAKNNKCDDCLHPAGSAWSGPFFEHFEWNAWPLGQSGATTKAKFLTYLDVKTAYSPPSNPTQYRVDYCLDDVQSASFGVGKGTGTIVTDQGFTRIFELEDLEDGWFEIEAHKMIRFEGWRDSAGNPIDAAVNFDANVFLQGLGDGTLNLACCAVPGAPTCPSP